MSTSRHDIVRDRLDEYALGYLSSADRAAVEQHIASCADCAAELRELLELAGTLASTAPHVTPSAALKSRVLAALAEIPQEGPSPTYSTDAARPGRPAISTWFLAAAATIALVLGAMLYLATQQSRELEMELARAEQQQRELQERLDGFAGQADRAIAILTAGDMRPLELAAPSGPSAATARAYWSPSQGLLLVADDLPEPPAGRIYQVWLIAGAGASPVSAGLLGEDGSRRGMLLVPPPAPIGGVSNVTVAITDEPPGGLAAPTGSMRLIGSL